MKLKLKVKVKNNYPPPHTPREGEGAYSTYLAPKDNYSWMRAAHTFMKLFSLPLIQEKQAAIARKIAKKNWLE